MPVLLVTHAELYREGYLGNTPHPFEILPKIYEVVTLTMEFIKHDNGKLTVLFMGDGNRYEEVFLEFRNQASYESPPCIDDQRPDMITGISWMLGGPSSRKSKKGNMVYSTKGLKLYRDHCHLLSDCVSVDDAWNYVKRIDEMHEGYKVFCSGRQQLISLGYKDAFDIASVFQLDWNNRSLKCIIKDGKLL